jgi:flagellar motor switch protein FliN/FliY
MSVVAKMTESAKPGELQKPAEAPKLAPINGDLFRGVRVALSANLGRADMTVGEMMALKTGSVVALETGLADYVELILNEAVVARGEIVAVGDKFGVRIVEIAPAS